MNYSVLAQRSPAPPPRHNPAPTTPAGDGGGGEGDIMHTALNIVEIVLSAISVIVFLCVLGVLLRYFWRYVYHKMRLAYLGGIVWNEIKHETSVSDSELTGSVAQMNNMADIVRSSIGGAFKFYFGRPMTFLVIMTDPDDDSVHLYLGMDSRHYDDNLVQGWAAGANCVAERLEDHEIPQIIPRAPSVATVEGYDAQSITDSPQNSTLGQVMSKMQGQSKSTDGAVIIAYEPMRQSDENLTRKHIETESQILEGLDSPWDGSARNLGIMMSLSPSRGTMTAFSSDGSSSTSSNMLSAVRANIPALGVRIRATTLPHMHRLYGFYGILASIPLMIASFFHLLSWWFSIPTFIMGVIAALGLPILSSFWTSLSVKQTGTVPIPPFWRYSLRRLFHEQIKRNWMGNKHKRGIESYTGPPSCKEILTFYQTSLMQFASVPTTGSGVTNITSSAVPQLGMPKSVDSDIAEYVDTDDVIYLGMSAKTGAPVYRTFADINFGIAVGGDAGSGKTNVLQVDYMGMCRLSRKKSGQTRDAMITPIWFETKSDDLSELKRLIKPYKPLSVAIHDPNFKARLSLEGARYGDEGVTLKDVRESNNQLISAMAAIWGESFGPRSRQVATASLMLASLLTPDGIRQIICGRGAEDMSAERVDMMVSGRIRNVDRPNIIRLMYILIGGDPSLEMIKNLEGYAEDLRSILMDKSKMMEIQASHGEGEINRIKQITPALDALINLHKQSEAVAPMQNKLPQLLESDGVWETLTEDGEKRKEYSLDKFLDYGGPVILDLTPMEALSRENAELFCMMLHQMLWQRIQKIGGGWGAQKRFTPLYADEISNFTGKKGTDSECGSIISKVREQGRSFGVSHNVGFQNFTQMPTDVARNVASFESKIYLRFSDPEDLEKVVRYLGDRTRYSTENFRKFPQGFGVALMNIGRTPRSEFTIKTPYSKTWAHALESKRDIRDSFDLIHDDEMREMRNQGKKKIDPERSPDPRRGRKRSKRVDDDTDSYAEGPLDRGGLRQDAVGDERDADMFSGHDSYSDGMEDGRFDGPDDPEDPPLTWS